MSGSLWIMGLVFALGMLIIAGFSVVLNDVRYVYIVHLARSVAEARERFQVGAYAFETYLLVEIRNAGSSSLIVKEIKVLAVLNMYNVTTNASETRLDIRTAQSILVPPLTVKYVELNFTPTISYNYERIEIASATITVITENSVTVVQTLTPLTPVYFRVTDLDLLDSNVKVVEISNETVIAYEVYEVLFCGLVYNAYAWPNRVNPGIPVYDSIWMNVRGGSTSRNVTRHYGFNWTSSTRLTVNITVNTTRVDNLNVTTCVFGSNATIPFGTLLFIGRGLLFISTHYLQYEVSYVMRRRNETPRYYSPQELGRGNRVSVAVPQTQFVVLKVPLTAPSVDEATDYVGQHLLHAIARQSSVVSIGSFQVQAMLIAHIVYGPSSTGSAEVEISAYLPRLVPVTVFLSPYEPP